MLKNNIGLYDIMYSETGRQGLKLSIHFTRYQVHERSWNKSRFKQLMLYVQDER